MPDTGDCAVGLVNSRKILSLKDRRQDSSARQDRRMHRTIKGPSKVRMEGWQARICNTGKEGFFFAGQSSWCVAQNPSRVRFAAYQTRALD